MRFRVVIPARYAAERLPGKPLRDIGGKPLIEHVYRAARGAGAESVTVATDDERIATECQRFGADACLTASSHASGTDRIAEVALQRDWDENEIVVNLQGDEPLMPPPLLERVATLLASDPGAGVATVATPIHERGEYLDPNVVKVVLDQAGRGMYFSRAPIPAVRTSGMPLDALRHVGLYAYRVGTLQTLAALPPCPPELSERLEQLRALWNGIAIAVAVVDQAPPPGIDTAEDLARVARMLSAGSVPVDPA